MQLLTARCRPLQHSTSSRACIYCSGQRELETGVVRAAQRASIILARRAPATRRPHRPAICTALRRLHSTDVMRLKTRIADECLSADRGHHRQARHAPQDDTRKRLPPDALPRTHSLEFQTRPAYTRSGYTSVQKQKGPKMHQNTHFAVHRLNIFSGERAVPSLSPGPSSMARKEPLHTIPPYSIGPPFLHLGRETCPKSKSWIRP